jgi:hypothetical protein
MRTAPACPATPPPLQVSQEHVVLLLGADHREGGHDREAVRFALEVGLEVALLVAGELARAVRTEPDARDGRLAAARGHEEGRGIAHRHRGSRLGGGSGLLVSHGFP